MAMPTVTVEVAFTTDPGATPTWTDVSNYLKAFTVHRGRADELAAFSGGQATITLANEDRRFDPSYASSPYSPNVVPMRRIRIRATYNAITYDVFNGYVTNWQQQYRHPQDADATVEATDAFKVLGNVTLPGSVYAVEIGNDAPTHWWRLGEPSGSTTAFDVGLIRGTNGAYNGGVSLGQGGAPTHDPDTAATFDGVDDYVQLYPTPLIAGTTYTVEMWLKIADRSAVTGWFTFFTQSTNNNTAANSQPWGIVTGNDLGDPGKVWWDTLQSTNRIDDGAWHHVALVSNAGAQTLYIDGQPDVSGTATSAGAGGNGVFIGYPANAPGAVAVSRKFWPGSIDEVAIWTATALSSARILEHNNAGDAPWRGQTTGTRIGKILDAAGWPAADRNIDTGTSILQSADLGLTALAALQQVEETEFGALFVTGAGLVRFIARDNLLKAPYTTSQGTFGDSGSELEFGDLTFEYDDDLIYNEAQVSRAEGTVMTVSDTTSQTKYLRRTKVVDGLLHQDDATSLSAANWIVAHYKDPLLRVTGMRLEPAAGNEATHFPQVLGRELMDRVTINRRPQNLGAAITQQSMIQGITHTVTPVEWVTQWNLSPAETQAYWILGVTGFSELGQTTRLGF